MSLRWILIKYFPPRWMIFIQYRDFMINDQNHSEFQQNNSGHRKPLPAELHQSQSSFLVLISISSEWLSAFDRKWGEKWKDLCPTVKVELWQSEDFNDRSRRSRTKRTENISRSALQKKVTLTVPNGSTPSFLSWWLVLKSSSKMWPLMMPVS